MYTLYAKHIFSSLINAFFSRDGIVLKFIIATWLMLSDVHLYIHVTIGFTLVDIFTGIWASYLKGKKFESKIFWNGIIMKLALYMILIPLMSLMDKVMQSVFNHESFYMSFLVTMFILVYETSSIVENIIVINPSMTFLLRFKNILNTITDKQIKKIENTLGEDDKPEPTTPETPKEEVEPVPVVEEIK